MIGRSRSIIATISVQYVTLRFKRHQKLLTSAASKDCVHVNWHDLSTAQQVVTPQQSIGLGNASAQDSSLDIDVVAVNLQWECYPAVC